MPLQIGLISCAHLHAAGYAHGLARQADRASLGYVWDDVRERGERFANEFGGTFEPDLQRVVDASDAVLICSENVRHIEHLEAAAEAGKPALCEKPIVPTEAHGQRLESLIAAGARIMTAFPCRYSPVVRRLRERLDAGDIGELRAVCATNRGRCPFGWFVDPALSGGGAMIDHVVHVADLLRYLTGCEVVSVTAQTGNQIHGQTWEDTAMLTLELANGAFATLDSSWSRPANYKTWGDVTLNLVGDIGVIEADLFAQQFETYTADPPRFGVAGFGSDLDAALVDDFLTFVEGAPAPITALDGWRAAQVAIAGYRSAAERQPVAVG